MNDYPTTLRVIAAFKAGEDLAERLGSAVKAQNAMADALRNAADYIERLEALRVEDGKQMTVLIAECQEMKDRLLNGDDVKISCKKTDDAPEAHAKSDGKHGFADTARATLTAAEREAIEWAAKWITTMVVPSAGLAHAHVDSLRKLLERLK
jgi:hypothetical protein